MKQILPFFLASLTLASLTTVALAENREQKDSSRASINWGPAGDAPKEIINRAIAAHKSLKNVPASVIDRAECVVVVPGLTTAAVGIGGSHGDGVASCRTEAKQWSRPAFVDLDAASLGVQLGAKNTDLVLYILSDKSKRALKEGNIMLGADASVVAGKFDKAVDISGADAVAYQNNSGAFLGAAVGAGTITADHDSNRAFYGREISTSEILNGKESGASEAADRLAAQLG